ncbi:hypothetical protein L6R29_17175 [Myxococcota bacterium]|nr:hypothetical protein [Myxococcota bacterium]
MKPLVRSRQPHQLLRRAGLCAFLLTGVLLAGVLWIPRAIASPNDIHLHFLYRGRDLRTTPEGLANDKRLRGLQQLDFALLSAELGFALAEPLMAPAETLGIAGFDIGVGLTVADIPEKSAHWARAVEDERPDNNVIITRLRFRKGLPLSFEIEGSLGFIHDSSHMLGAVAVKWALNEGFYYFPDIAVRVSINRLFNSRDLDLFNFTGDIIVSKHFAIAGMFLITPYLAYSLVWARSNSQVLDPTPKVFSDNESVATGNFVFTTENALGSRINFGLQLVWYILNITLEGAFTIPNFSLVDPNNPGNRITPATIGMFNAKFSLTF